MITKQQRARLAVFTVVSTILLAVFLGVLVYPSFRDRGESYRVNFKGTSVNGLDVSAAVKYRGVAIGRVDRIQVNPDDLDSILVEMKIVRGFPVRRDMAATLTYTGITGTKFVEISGGSGSSEDLPPGGEIPMSRGLGEKAEDIVANIDEAVKNLNVLLGPGNQERFAQFLAKTEQSADVVSRVLQSKEENLSRAVVNIEKASEVFGGTIESLKKISTDLGRLIAKLDETGTAALDNLGKRFSDEEMGRVIRGLDGFVSTASSSIKKIEDVLLVQQKDLRDMVQGLAAAIENLSLFSRELVEDPTALLRSGKKGKK
jgi:phospholipid/cholesterol/gamma-HCH transport system substrate-binding protein